MFLKFADWFVYQILGLSESTSLGSALHFFVYDVLKILFLLFTIITVIWFFVLLGIGVGAFLHGYVPQLAQKMFLFI